MNNSALKHQTIKLVADPTNTRAQLFKSLLATKSTYEIVGEINPDINPDCDYNIFFGLSGYADDPDTLLLLFNEYNLRKTGYSILDIDNDTPFVDAYIMYMAVAANFTTCATSELQENIYECTGRLATIVDRPITQDMLCEPDTKSKVEIPSKLKVVWYGEGQERFTIKPYLDKHPFIKAVTSSRISDKEFETTVLDWADVIFLPKAFTPQDEFSRLAKAEWCTQMGKFVACPGLELDYEGISHNLDLDEALMAYIEAPNLEEWIRDSQRTLLKKYNPDISTDQLIFALKEAPKDDFTSNLDYFIEQDVT